MLESSKLNIGSGDRVSFGVGFGLSSEGFALDVSNGAEKFAVTEQGY